MRKIISIFLALTFVLYLGGIQVMYWIKMSVNRQEVQTLLHGHKLSRRKTVDFSFTPSEYNSLSWSEENKEFSYKGQQYDIIGMKYFSDEIILQCYPDNDETNLMDAFSGFIKSMFSSPQHNDDNNNDMVSKIFKEYISTQPLMPAFIPQVSTPIKAKCVLVKKTSAEIDGVWRPPTLV